MYVIWMPKLRTFSVNALISPYLHISHLFLILSDMLESHCMSLLVAVGSCLVFVLKIAEMSSLRGGLLKLDWSQTGVLHQNRLCLPKSRWDEIYTFCMLSFGLFPGFSILYADVSEHCSVFIGGWMCEEWIRFANVGVLYGKGFGSKIALPLGRCVTG